MLPHEVSAFSELDQRSKEGLDAVSLVSTSLATGESVIASGMLATVPECIIIETFLSVIKIDLPWFLATCCAQAALESLPFFAFCLLHRTLPVVWGRFWVVEQLLWTFVQVFWFGVWLIHPRNVHNVYVFSVFTINRRVKKNLPSSEISVRPPFKSLVLVSLETASKIFNPEIVVKLVRCINVLVFIPEFS